MITKNTITMRHSFILFTLTLFVLVTGFAPNTKITLTDSEKDGLLLMREEEKLAHEVYTAMFAKWNHKVFNNIKQSEAYHGELVKGLITKYGLNDPYVAEIGKYKNETLQKLYNKLITKGKISLVDAFEVGALIEDIDIADLDKLITATQNADLKDVYETLNLGSRNHMRAFDKQLRSNNIIYKPTYITQERFEAIIKGDHETCVDNKAIGFEGASTKGCVGNGGKACAGGNGAKACAGSVGKNSGQGMAFCNGSIANRKGCCK